MRGLWWGWGALGLVSTLLALSCGEGRLERVQARPGEPPEKAPVEEAPEAGAPVDGGHTPPQGVGAPPPVEPGPSESPPPEEPFTVLYPDARGWMFHGPEQGAPR
ncbi:MAG TPA: hypothetical protein VLQ93_24575, partial [Myxococcaceae bacterium]|nr:hypothetical protein [Myxococcaceae bacterium]